MTDIYARFCENDAVLFGNERPANLNENWPFLPTYEAFKNLRRLDLRNLTGDLPDLYLNVAEVLLNSPNIKVLALEISYIYWEETDRTRYLHVDFLRSVTAYFHQLAEERGHPGIKLAIEHLVLGLGVFDTASEMLDEDFECLSSITNLSKLQTLQLLNYRTARQPGWWDNYQDLNPKILRAATNLRKLGLDVLSKGAVGLVKSLLGTSKIFREIKIEKLLNYAELSGLSREWPPPRPEILGGGWREVLVGGSAFDRCENSDIRHVLDLFRQCKDLEDIALPYISWVRLALADFCMN